MIETISHASVLVVVRPGKIPGQIEAISFLYTTKKNTGPYTAWKFPTETGEYGETPWQTASNGMYRELSEVPDNPTGFDFCVFGDTDSMGEPIPFLISRVPGDPLKRSDWHDKYVYIIFLDPKSVSMLRKQKKQDEPNEILDIPEFVEVGELWRRMAERGQPFHRAVLFRVIKRFSGDLRVRDRYSWILNNPCSWELMKSRGDLIRFNGDK